MVSQQVYNQVCEITKMYTEGKLNPHAYFGIMGGIASTEPIDEAELDAPTILYRRMEELRHRNDPALVPAIEEAIELNRSILPAEFLHAVSENLAAYDGRTVPGEVMRNGLLAVSADQARKYNRFPTGKEKKPGTVLLFGRLPSLLLKPEPYVYPGGYTGTYMELWLKLLDMHQRLNALRPLRPKSQVH